MDLNFTSAELHRYAAKFQANKHQAKERGIPFELTFEEWLTLWADRIEDRGSGRGKYNLCRKNDLGSYVVGNCYVARVEHNSSVRGYMETRTNCHAYGNVLDQRQGWERRWNSEDKAFLDPLITSLFRMELEPQARKDAIKGLAEEYVRRYRRAAPEVALKVADQVVHERLNTVCKQCVGVGDGCKSCNGSGTRRHSDWDRAARMQMPLRKIRELNHKINWLALLVSDAFKPSKKQA